jgi:hypothetical protein
MLGSRILAQTNIRGTQNRLTKNWRESCAPQDPLHSGGKIRQCSPGAQRPKTMHPQLSRPSSKPPRREQDHCTDFSARVQGVLGRTWLSPFFTQAMLVSSDICPNKFPRNPKSPETKWRESCSPHDPLHSGGKIRQCSGPGAQKAKINACSTKCPPRPPRKDQDHCADVCMTCQSAGVRGHAGLSPILFRRFWVPRQNLLANSEEPKIA